MKRFFILGFVLLLVFGTNLFSQMKMRIKEGNEYVEKTLPVGTVASSITFKDSVIKTFYYGKNIEKDVIIEFKTPPVKTFRGQKNFNFKENNRLIELVKLEQMKFFDDIESIINKKNQLNDTSLQDAEYRIYFSYRIAINGIALHTTQWVIDEISKLDYVKKIHDVVEVRINDDVSNHLIGADSIWYNLGVTGEGVLIAIIDTGIDSNHVALNNGKVIGGYNVFNNNSNFFDDNGHGTHCAGIAAANGGGLTGVAPGSSLLGVKVLSSAGSAPGYYIIAGIEYSLDPDGNPNTDDGADILSMSLGGSGSPDDAMSVAVDNAVTNGALCAVAAGNNGPNNYTIESPGCAKLAFTVGASDNSDNIASFSSRGPVNQTFDIKPDIVAPGVNINSSLPNNNFGSMSGTSMATPHIAGAAALLKQLHPDWTPEQIKSSFMGTALDIGADVWSQGSGRVDVYKAAQTNSILAPSSINFGFVDLSQSVWTKSDTLKLYNYSNESKTYYLTLEQNFPEGFSYTIEPDIATIDGNSNTDIVFTIYVDNSIFPFSNQNIPTYNGRIIAGTGTEILKANFEFEKVKILNLYFDNVPWVVLIHNRLDKYYLYQYKDTLNIPFSLDTFDIMIFFQDLSTVIKEDLLISGNFLNLNINKSDAINNIKSEYYDSYNNQFYPSLYGQSIIHRQNSWGFTIYGGLYLNYYISNFSSNYKFNTLRNAYHNIGNSIFDSYSTSFAINSGLDSSMTINISPNTSTNIYHLYTFNNNIYIEDFIGDNKGEVLCPSSYCFLNFPLKRNYYYYFGGLTNFYNRISYSYSPNSGTILESPYIINNGNTIDFFNFDKVEPTFSFSRNDTIDICNHYPIFKGRCYNEFNMIFIRNDPKLVDNSPAFFQDIYGFNKRKNLQYYLYDTNDNVIDSGYSINGVNSLYYKPSILSGNYKIELFYDSTYINDFIGNAKATLKFNTSLDDKNPPYIKKLLISKDTIIKDYYYINDSIKISSIIRDDANVDSVKFFFKKFENETWIQLQTENIDDNYFTSINPLDTLGYYSIKIEAKDTSNNVLVYEINPAFIVTKEMLDPVTLINPLNNNILLDSCIFIWTSVPNATSYRIQVSSTWSFEEIVIDDSLSNTIFIPVEELSSNTKYYWRVMASANDYSSSWSDIWYFTTITKSPILLFPQNDSFNYTSNPNFIWHSVENSNVYTIQVSTDSVFSSSNILIFQDISDTSLIPTIIFNPQTKYFWRVQASFNGLNPSQWSDIWNFYYIQKLQTPILISPSNNSVNQSLTPVLYWSSVIGSNDYNIQVSKNIIFDSLVINLNIIGTSFISYNLLDYNTQYYWRVCAFGEGFCSSDWSEIRNFHTINNQNIIATPNLLSPTNSSNYVSIKPTFYWFSIPNIDYYTVQLSYSNDFNAIFYELVTSSSNYELITDTLNFNSVYFWRVKANIEGNISSSWSDVWNFTTENKNTFGQNNLYAWGLNDYGQLGDSTTFEKKSPVFISPDSVWSKIDCGFNYSIGIKRDGDLWAWGCNFAGQLGDSTKQRRISPIKIGNDTSWNTIACGYEQTLAIKNDGTLWGWGANGCGQVGSNPGFSKLYPEQIGTYNSWKSIASGHDFSIGIMNNGTLWVWGHNDSGQLGLGDSLTGYNFKFSTPIQMGSDSNWSSVTCGSYHTAALKSNGTLWAWGENYYRQLGDGTIIQRNQPVQIGTDSNWVFLTSGGTYNLAIKNDCTLWGWGQCGNLSSYVPVQIGLDSNWKTASVGYRHCMAVKNDGSLWTWGRNLNGALGDGTYNDKSLPSQIGNFNDAVSISASFDFSLVLREPLAFLSAPVLFSPQNLSFGVSLYPEFIWSSVLNSTNYIIQLSFDSTFNNIVFENNLSNTFLNIENSLNYNTEYYWRIKADASDFNPSPWSEVWSFTTLSNDGYSISGTITYANTVQTPMTNTTVELKQGGNVIATTVTNADGFYQFNNVANGTYQISASTDKAWGGLTAADAIITKRAIVNLVTFTNIQTKAADVNMSNNISAVDALLMQRKYVNLSPPQWTVPNYVYEQPEVTVDGVNQEINFKALCGGDVNGSFIPAE